MNRLASLLIFLLLTDAVCAGQEFLCSPDYIYGCASDCNEQRADSLALLSFAKCVDLTVETSTEYSFSESGKTMEERHHHQVNIHSGVRITGLKKYVEHYNGLFTVYYFFNKEKYISNCLSSFHENLRIADSYKDSGEAHARNLMLGYSYLAYETVSDPLFKSLYSYGKYLESQALDKITDVYKHSGYLLSARNVGNVNPSGILLIRDENCKILPGFEYADKQGGWSVPRAFLDHQCNTSDFTNAAWAYIYTYDNEYRFLFEIKTEYGIQNLHVPDSFYKAYCGTKRFFR